MADSDYILLPLAIVAQDGDVDRVVGGSRMFSIPTAAH